MKKSILLLAFLFISNFIFSQLVYVYYELEYNEMTDLFDCKMFVEAGSATSAADRLLIDAQYSIVVATGTTLTVAESYLPLLDNENYMGTVPMDWTIDQVEIDPAELPGYDVYSIVPDNVLPSHFNNLSGDDQITLFSLSAVGGDICSISLRIFENDVDPTSIGGDGVDFSNALMVGSSNDSYVDNFASNDIWSDVDITINEGSICEGECITLTATFNCIFPGLEYEWSTGETTESITVCPEVNTAYLLNLSGPFEYGGEVESNILVDNGIYAEFGTDLCLGIPVNFLPESGLWASSDEDIATVNNEGLVTPIAEGTAVISHTTSTGDCFNEVVINVLDPEPPTITGSDEICVDETTQLSPSSGVTWQSGNNAIATVDNSGLVTGVGLGSTVFTYTTIIGQCESDPSPTVAVSQIPEPIITGPDTICIGAMTTLTPSAGIIWESTDPSIATIDNSGNVTGIAEGKASFYFTDMANGCISGESDPVVVLPSPIVQLSADTVCQGESVIATTNFDNGTWTILVVAGNPHIPTIDPETGIITTVESGTLSVHYTSEDGCISDDSVLLTVLPKPKPTVSSNSPICVGENIILSAASITGAIYDYQWTGPNGFSSNQVNVIIPNAAQIGQTLTYTLVASENGCVSDTISIDVTVEDCDPCGNMDSIAEWIKIPASMDDFTPLYSSYGTGGTLVTGRELEDIIYFKLYQDEMRLIKNNGEGYFDEQIVLFELPFSGNAVAFDIVDIDQDGLNDIVTFQLDSTIEPNDLTITIFKNLDDYSFENSLQIVMESGFDYYHSKRKYIDLDNQGFLDIVPLNGTIYFTDNWEKDSFQFPDNVSSILLEDFNEDGLLDIFGNEVQLFTNNGDRTFSPAMILGNSLPSQGLYDYSTGAYTDGYRTYQVTKGSSPGIDGCSAFPGITDYQISYFYANINSSNVEDGVIASQAGFHVFETPLTCENTSNFETITDFIPQEKDKIDFTGNGYSDFITVEDGEIFVWINPNELPKLRGTAFIDNNGDGILNENDSPLRNVLVSIEPGDLSVLTDDNGNYQFAVPEGSYTLTANVNEGEWITDELIIENVDIIEPCNLGFDFGFVPDPTPMPAVNLSMVNTIARCDFEVRFTITVENTGTEALDSRLQFEFDDKTSFFSTEIVGASVVGNKVIADIGPLVPFQPQKYEIKVKMPGGSAVLPMLDFKATLFDGAGDIIAAYGYAEQLRCSYDPNDKREFPNREGDDNLTLMDEDIEYTIRFQNNGNDTAYNVKIVDPLDVNIEPSSIRVVGSSHDVETCIEGTDLIFLFENIYLVDSTTNYPSSQGYVTYKCNAKSGRAEFTAVNNTADIFFDTNLPITTNTTLNTLVSKLCSDKTTIIDKYICDGEEYLGLTESGTYTESFDLLYGCDSLVTINLTVQGITYSQQSLDVCGEISILIGAEEYFIDSDTTITDTITNDQGCITSILNYEFKVISDLVDIEKFELCIDEIGSVPTNLNGLWSSNNESIITIDDAGIITTINSGIAFLQYTDLETGCIDEVEVEVYPEPVINNEGSDQICIDEYTQLTSDMEGTWSSSDPEIATITIDGLVLGKNTGNVIFTFTNSTTGCSNFIDVLILPATDSNCLVSTSEVLEESIKLYPNPASESVYVESRVEWKALRLINAQGQHVSQEITGYKSKKRIDLSEVASGLYFVIIEMEGGVIFKKFVVD